MTRDEMMAVIHRAYAARLAGDVDGVMEAFHSGARFRIAGAADLIPAAAGVVGHEGLRAVMSGLIEGFEFLENAERESIVEGDRVVIHWRAKIRHTGSGEVVDTDLCDLFTFGEDGKIASLLQFCDTATVRRLVGG